MISRRLLLVSASALASVAFAMWGSRHRFRRNSAEPLPDPVKVSREFLAGDVVIFRGLVLCRTERDWLTRNRLEARPAHELAAILTGN